MPGKRKREGEITPTSSSLTSERPISAVAAARQRALEGTQGKGGEECSAITPTLPLHDAEVLPIDKPDPPKSDTRRTFFLKKDESISFVGQFDLTVLQGAVNVGGANLSAKAPNEQIARVHRVYVPSKYPCMTIRGLDFTNEVRLLSCKDDPTPLQPITTLFNGIWLGVEENKGEETYDTLYEPPNHALQQEVENCLKDSLITFTLGASRTGKSTFARRLINRWLTGLGKKVEPLEYVYFLDLDSEVPEYTPPGQISLVRVQGFNLEPPFTRPSSSKDLAIIVRAHPQALQQAPSQREHFVSSCRDLFLTYLSLKPPCYSVPLIVNAPGWLYNLQHFPTFREIMSELKPHCLVHLTTEDSVSSSIASHLDTLRATDCLMETLVHHVRVQEPIWELQRTYLELISMHMLSYFHCAGYKSAPHPEPIWDLRPLSAVEPWEFCYEDTETCSQDFFGFLLLADVVPSSELLTVLNGSLIQIVETEEDAQPPFDCLARTRKSRIPYFDQKEDNKFQPINPETSRLVCTALVRSFDPARKVVQIIVPKTHETHLQGLDPRRTIFVYGCCRQPDWAYTEDAYYDDWLAGKRTDSSMHNVAMEKDLPPWIAPAAMSQFTVPRRHRKYQE